MPMIDTPPLNKEDWDALIADLEKGQSKEQAEAMEKALNSKDVPETVW